MTADEVCADADNLVVKNRKLWNDGCGCCQYSYPVPDKEERRKIRDHIMTQLTDWVEKGE